MTAPLPPRGRATRTHRLVPPLPSQDVARYKATDPPDIWPTERPPVEPRVIFAALFWALVMALLIVFVAGPLVEAWAGRP